MEEKAGVRIGLRAFIQSILILFVLMMIAGVLTLVLKAGNYERTRIDGREVIDPASFQLVTKPDYPIWRWFVAPVEVLGSKSGLVVITIIMVLFFAGGAIGILDKTGTLRAFIGNIVQRFRSRKYLLLMVVSLAFMFLTAVLGTVEEFVLLVPVMVALSYSLGWDALVGLGLSIMAANMGFTAAITNPFTVGVSQQLAKLPPFSGIGLRLLIFLVIYAIYITFLITYARKIDQNPSASLVYHLDKGVREKYKGLDASLGKADPKQNRAILFFGLFLLLGLGTMLISPFVPAVANYALPIVGVLFLAGGLVAGLLSGAGNRKVWQGLIEGMSGIAPSVPLILMAACIRYIIDSGGVTDTILHAAAGSFTGLGAFPAALVVLFLALGMEFFITSGSAKAFLMMPIILPLADMIHLTRQTAILAYMFGDGFTNMAYPTNPMLLISLGLTVVSYPKWMRWTVKLWLWVAIATIIFLGIAIVMNYGPF